MIAFWILAPIMVAAALGLLFARKAVHCALLLAVVMISLAVLYAVQDAPFLFAVQIIVYTGAILMLFLFVLMLVGVDSVDSVVETIKGQRVWAAVLGLLFGLTLTLGVAQVSTQAVTGLTQANAEGNVPSIAKILFSRYVLAFETTSLLLITAVLGAMVLAHRERLSAKLGQAERAAQRMRDYADHGKPLGPLPSPGVFARHNAVDTPALLPDGTPSAASVPQLLTARGDVRSATALADDIVELTDAHVGDDAAPKQLAAASGAVNDELTESAAPAASEPTDSESGEAVSEGAGDGAGATTDEGSRAGAGPVEAAAVADADEEAAPLDDAEFDDKTSAAGVGPAADASGAQAGDGSTQARGLVSSDDGSGVLPIGDDTAATATAAEAVAESQTLPAGEFNAGNWAGSLAPRADGSAPEGHAIKGNLNSMLYHRPGGRWYAVTVAEVWFDTAESAEAAGFSEAGKRKKGDA